MKSMRVVHCWDDGVESDVRLVDLLRKHGAKATFNLNPGLHKDEASGDWNYKGNTVRRIPRADLATVYAGFTIANHTVSHPHLEQIPIEQARREIIDGRKQLQDLFQQPVTGFAYPYGTYNDAVMDAVREAGHVYARTVGTADHPYPPANPMAFHPTCHFLAPDFWTRYERARSGGVFYFWGHSYELRDEALWTAFDNTLARITADPHAEWTDVCDLFTP